ncbi:type I polyketide synthase [Chelatococcus reniformis]|uniref:Polyketide synthase n=1 Tax=Chelatococcus reniformis TaxID=1494448 RepID=A0A916UN49_9HYPH|nr:type I polyketide synthase [Chelatococcus reniformis]GGC78292.1 polyketide synthase [Chelatococcus reniformis]
MNVSFQNQQANSELLRRALAAIDQLQVKLAQAEAAQHEPIAIIGIGCRFPGGAEDPEALWQLLVDGVDAVTEVPLDRWDVAKIFDPDPNAAGKTYTKWGAFLDGVDMFDAPFFGITPREAVNLDPQQRLLLEMSWLALEDAGIAPLSVANTRTGVYVGVTALDYVQILARSSGPEDAYALSGTAHSIAGGRISYFLGAQGPNISVDTACSSSMVAVHLAVKGLRARESDLAIAGGVNVTLIPDASILTSRARMMSPTGRCHAFDAAADGYVRAEGAGMIALKRLSDAERDGDRILALIRGSALNQDGRSSGLTAPHGPSQEAVIRAALEDAQVTPGDITFVEAHGTGTSLGDPIEVNALGNVFGGRPADRPLLIGSIKANIGHTEGAAGIAGMIKAVQALRHRALPRQLHLQTPNPMIDWDKWPVRVPLETTPLALADDATPLLCGISSFGFSGTNAHVVLQEPPAPPAAERGPHPADASTLLVLSARTDDAARELAGRYAALLEREGGPSLRDVAAAAPLARSPFPQRVGVVAADAAEAAASLAAFARGDAPRNVVHGRATSAAAPEVVFLFTGQGAQYAGMGKGLYETEPAFRQALDECDRLARPHMDRGLLDVILGDQSTLIDQTTYTQPALFALEYALAMTWRAWGIEPTAVMGHSVGEYSAACFAGMIPLADALRLIATRGRLMGALPAGGAMAAVMAPEPVVRSAITAAAGRLDIAAVNGPASIVVSGAADALDELLGRLRDQGIEAQRLNVSHAFHSALMEPILDEFEQALAATCFAMPSMTVMSNLSGTPLGAEALKPDYWRRHLRHAVRFADSVAHLQRDGYRLFLEVGPAPILSGMAKHCGGEPDCAYVGSLRRGRDDRRSMLEAAAQLYVAGAQLNWPAITGERAGHTSLPTYPFQRTRFWRDDTRAMGGMAMQGHPTSHPLLGLRTSSPVEIYTTELGVQLQPWAHDHRIFDYTPFPAAGFLELALAAATERGGKAAALENVTIGQGLLLPEAGAASLQVVVTPDADGRKTVQIYSAAGEDGPSEWRLHVTAQVVERGTPASPPLAIEEAGWSEASVDDYYGRMDALGAHYGPALRGVRSMRRHGRTVVAEIALPAGLSPDGYGLHPALLDACFQPMGLGMEEEGAAVPSTDLYMPVAAKRYSVWQPAATAVTCRVAVTTGGEGSGVAEADFAIFDAAGALVAEVIGFEVRRITRAALERQRRANGPKADWRFGVEWLASAPNDDPSQVAGQNWLILADQGGVGDGLAAQLRLAGASAELVPCPGSMTEADIAAAVAAAAPIDRPLHGAVLLWPLDGPEGLADLTAIEAAHATHVTAALFALRAVVNRAARVMVVTRATQQLGQLSADLVQTPIWTFAGVAASEYPTCGLARIDLDAAREAEDGDRVFAEACSRDGEDRVAYRGGERFVARLKLREQETTAEGTPVLLDIAERGSLGNLSLVAAERRPPGPGEVEIRVHATGLNFRDVLNALGMYQGEAGPLGNECAGVVTAVGAGVTRLSVGEDVVAMVDRSFASYVIAPETMTVRKPPFVSYQEAATVPVTFLTADYALRALSHIKPGDRVLIHAVTGGVGMAATQIALRAGATVFGTAGTAAKRVLARSLGVHFVSDSRSLDFVDDIHRDTGGAGVDIVLNSLAGEFIPASLGLVAQGGSFVEIGKTDIWTRETVAARFPGIDYHPLYLGEVAAAEPERIRSMLVDILADMDDGPLRPLPQTVYPLHQAEDAFRYMGQGLHTGKVVVTQPKPAAIRDDGVYVITGGLTGLGLTTAEWLVQQGARKLILMGRRAPGPDALSAIQRLETSGATVQTAQADVGDRAALADLLADARSGLGPIRGVLHAAGVLDDGMLSEQTPERFARVMAPKVRGGWLLHELTLSDPLDFFVLFSSGASLLGSPGQGNYAAANGFLDALASYRHASGRPALSISWGSWAEVGMAAGVGEDHHRRWAAMGLEMITPDSGMEMLGALLASGDGPQVAAVPIVRSRLPATVGPFYRGLVDASAAAAEPTLPVTIGADLRAAEPEARRGLLDAFLADQVLRVLALPATQKVDRHERLLNLGMDSLMAMEFRNRVLAALGVRLAVADLLGGASLTDVGRIVMSELAFDDGGPGEAPAVDAEMEWEEGQL